jgi:hypothetical protein
MPLIVSRFLNCDCPPDKSRPVRVKMKLRQFVVKDNIGKKYQNLTAATIKNL